MEMEWYKKYFEQLYRGQAKMFGNWELKIMIKESKKQLDECEQKIDDLKLGLERLDAQIQGYQEKTKEKEANLKYRMKKIKENEKELRKTKRGREYIKNTEELAELIEYRKKKLKEKLRTRLKLLSDIRRMEAYIWDSKTAIDIFQSELERRMKAKSKK